MNFDCRENLWNLIGLHILNSGFCGNILFRILAKILVVFCCASLPLPSIRVSGLKEIWKTVKRAKLRNRFAPKRGGGNVWNPVTLKGVTLFRHLKALFSLNLRRFNPADVLYRCPCMWNSSNDRGSISGRGCNFFYHLPLCVCVCVCACGRGVSALSSMKAYHGFVCCVKAVGTLNWLTLS